MKKHLRYLTNITHLSTLRFFSYPVDVLTFTVIMPIVFMTEILGIIFIFHAASVEHLLGYSLYEILFVGNLGIMIFQLASIGTILSYDTETKLLYGLMDSYFLRPISFIFQLSFRSIYIENFFLLTGRAIACIIIASLGDISFSLLNIVQLFFVIISSVIIESTLLLLAVSIHFFYPRTSSLIQKDLAILIESTREFPKEMYPD